MNGTFIFSLGFIVSFCFLIFLSAELYGVKRKMRHGIEFVRTSIVDQINENDSSFRAELNNATISFNSEIQEINRTSIKNEEEIIANLTATFEDHLKEKFTEINQTIQQQSNQVQQKVLNLTQDVGTYVNTTASQFSSQGSIMAFQFAGTFTILGVIIFMYHLGIHLRNFNEPFVQRKIIAMLWMVPIYCITAFCGLVFVRAGDFLIIVKDFYEGYCIYMFLSFLIAVLGRGDRAAVVELLAKRGNYLHLPFNIIHLCRRRRYANAKEKADSVLRQCQLAALQFVFLRPLTTICMVIADSVTAGQEVSLWNVHYPQFYITLIVNISVFFAFSGLLKFYHAVREDLMWCEPFPKFLCIKGVVFMTFWQGLAISLIANSSFEDEIEGKHWSLRVQNFIVCLEMFFFSIIHIYVFPPEEWEEGYRPAETVRRKFGDNIALRDFVHDVRTVLKVSRTKIKSDEETSPLTSTEEKVNALVQFDDEDDFMFINRIIKEAETLKLVEEAENLKQENEVESHSQIV